MKIEQLIRDAVLAMETHGNIDVAVFERPGFPLITVKTTLPAENQKMTDGHGHERSGPVFIILP